LLLIMHGGPGFAEMPLFTAYNAELERHFLVAHWDQRGAGRSYAADIPAESTTLRQFVADALELIDWLTERFAQEKVNHLTRSRVLWRGCRRGGDDLLVPTTGLRDAGPPGESGFRPARAASSALSVTAAAADGRTTWRVAAAAWTSSRAPVTGSNPFSRYLAS
jgi:pimeloyl-ACP methyl ester carboxylesterase